jgi:hypothetical protein
MKIKWIKIGFFDKLMIGLGWIVLSPLILAEILVMGYEWLIEKIKRKRKK